MELIKFHVVVFFRKRARVTEGATTSSSDRASGGCELAILKLQDSMNEISQQNQEVRALLMEIRKMSLP